MEDSQPTTAQTARDLVIGEIRRAYPPLLTVPQVAQLMQCSKEDVYDKVHRGEIPAVRWGKQFRFFRDEVIESLIGPLDHPRGDLT
ncbi:MAG: helix-turn-helix domain-containing protein [Acidimicrobiia bacterium]